LDDDNPYLKSAVLHQWIFSYELPDTIIVLTKSGEFYMLATKKKCEFVRPAADTLQKKASSIQHIHLLVRNKEDGNAENYEKLWKASGLEGGKQQIGVFLKERTTNISSGGILGPWEAKLTEGQEAEDLSLVDVAAGVAFVMSVKDESELDLMKKSSVLSNKVMKHGLVKKMEEVIDSEEAITHEALANYIEEILEDPSKISLKVPKEDVQSCYFPIVQSGGNNDLKVSAQSTGDKLSHDIITVSFGARYRNYCSNIARTFLVDPPKKVSETYEILLELQDNCLMAMKPGTPIKSVYKAAVKFLQDKAPHLAGNLPKNLGFATGIDFRETNFLLSGKNSATLKEGMVFCLSIGLQDIELAEEDRAATPDKCPVRIVLSVLFQQLETGRSLIRFRFVLFCFRSKRYLPTL
jgi:nucleosome binding factor SPN SPT16 subunit